MSSYPRVAVERPVPATQHRRRYQECADRDLQLVGRALPLDDVVDLRRVVAVVDAVQAQDHTCVEARGSDEGIHTATEVRTVDAARLVAPKAPLRALEDSPSTKPKVMKRMSAADPRARSSPEASLPVG